MSPNAILSPLAKAAAVSTLTIAIGVPLYGLPATLSLRPGMRPGIEPLTIKEAAKKLSTSGLQGWELIEAARALVAERMLYCRRNSFDPAPRAFTRGYGYCQQISFALTALLKELGFKARVVQSLRNRFENGEVSGHCWVKVTYQGESKYIDALFYDPTAGRITFEPLSRITGMGLLFRIFAGWGSICMNAHRYYRSGKDF
jgi:transglutaminase-like putative cysteine protease